MPLIVFKSSDSLTLDYIREQMTALYSLCHINYSSIIIFYYILLFAHYCHLVLTVGFIHFVCSVSVLYFFLYVLSFVNHIALQLLKWNMLSKQSFTLILIYLQMYPACKAVEFLIFFYLRLSCPLLIDSTKMTSVGHEMMVKVLRLLFWGNE